MRLASVDPGDPHVGTAVWELHDGLWMCVSAKEVTPERFADSLNKLLARGMFDRVAYEAFRLGGGQEALMQRGSVMPAAETIGQLKLLCRWYGILPEPVERDPRKATLTRMKAVKWAFPRGCGNHVRDAIAVGAHATGWRAADHVPGDGVRAPETAPRVVS